MSSLFTMVLYSGDVLRIQYEYGLNWRSNGTWDMSLVAKPIGLPGRACPIYVD
jgi:hypothetical protein